MASETSRCEEWLYHRRVFGNYLLPLSTFGNSVLGSLSARAYFPVRSPDHLFGQAPAHETA